MYTAGMGVERLGSRLKKARQQLGLSQEELAQHAGLSRIYVAKLEAGERRAPSLDALERLAKALRVKLVELIK